MISVKNIVWQTPRFEMYMRHTYSPRYLRIGDYEKVYNQTSALVTPKTGNQVYSRILDKLVAKIKNADVVK